MLLDVISRLLFTACTVAKHQEENCPQKTIGAPLWQNYKVVDLSYRFNDRTIYWDDQADYRLNVTIYNDTQAGWFQEDVVSEAIHGGTHLDSPVHFYKGGWDATEIPLERLLFVPVARVDVQDKVASNAEYLLSVQDVLDWEQRHGRLPDGCLFVAHTGQSKVGRLLIFRGQEGLLIKAQTLFSSTVIAAIYLPMLQATEVTGS
ncbi:hypothetical protein HPB48_004890 [Haemaphysalis longicornis]|uniref:Uncharacterized protein n=1 Tax=Haemaphysalis longicornis TaxID=44386 RepID=A0A9J6GE93_HAELO|nr:hypothetical protein HPB48_004890 [Haemaphysalis longicornis]